jgi:hypothetical protein
MVDPETLVTKAIHATKLVERDGQVIKSPARPVRLTSGYPRGCVIPLCHGESGLSLEQASHKNLVEALMLGEGLENSLTAHVEFPRLRLFAAGSVGNFANIALPPWYNPILLVRDREGPENMGPAAARRRAIEQWMRDGRRVEIIDPPPGVKDVNDAARAFARR